jgi:hypothetical protein
MRRLIVLAVVAAVFGGLGYWTYDRYLGRELRQGEALRDALAEELAAAGFAFTSMEYDWRSRRVVAEGIVATKMPRGVKGFSIGKAVYRGADPAAIRAALAETEADADAKAKRAELIDDLVLSDLLIAFDGGAEFKQASLNLKHLSLGKPVKRDGAVADPDVLRAVDFARRLHVRLLEAKDTRYWHPEVQGTYEQKLLRLEDYRAGNFSEFRLEGLSLSVAVVFRAKLDEYFTQSFKARRFLTNFHKTPFASINDMSSALAVFSGTPIPRGSGGEVAEPQGWPPAAEYAMTSSDTVMIGFELLIPAAGRIAFEEMSSTDRQFVNGLELGGKSKIVALELQFNMLTQVLTAGLDALGVDMASTAMKAGSEAQSWLASHAGNAALDNTVLTASLRSGDQPEDEKQPEGEAGKQPGTAAGPEAKTGEAPDTEEDEQVPTGPNDGDVEEGPAAPVPDVWGNEIEPPKGPAIDNKALAEIIRKLGFDNIRIDSESEAAYDEQAKVWEMPKFTFDMANFWSLAADARVSGVGALEDLGHVPIGADGWWQGPKAEAVGKRFMEEGRFEGLSFNYRDLGFITRLLEVIAELQNTKVESVVSSFVAELFSKASGAPLLQAEGLDEALKAFLMSPQLFSIRLQPAEPVPFSAFPAMEEEKLPFPEMAARLGLVLTFNEQSFADFKKTAPIGSDIESEQD